MATHGAECSALDIMPTCIDLAGGIRISPDRGREAVEPLADVRRLVPLLQGLSPMDKLDDIPWARLTHAHGSAQDVPGLIRSLKSVSAVEEVSVDGAWTRLTVLFDDEGSKCLSVPSRR